MKRHAHIPERYPTKEVTVSDLTTVELLWLEKRIENRIRFGRAVSESIVDRNRRILTFAPGSIFALFCARRYQGNAIRRYPGSRPAVKACCDYQAG